MEGGDEVSELRIKLACWNVERHFVVFWDGEGQKKGPVSCFQDTGRNTGNDLLSHNL